MASITKLIRLKKVTKIKHKSFLKDQQEYAKCVNWATQALQTNPKLSSAHSAHALKSAIKNEAIRRAKKALSDYKKGKAKRIPVFRNTMAISINNQNWDVQYKRKRWYIGFTSSLGKLYLPIYENEWVQMYFPYFKEREFRGTLQLLRKGRDWYVAIPLKISSNITEKHKKYSTHTSKQTPIGVDLGLRHIAVVSELNSGKRQFFSGKQVGYIRRHFRSLRRSLGKKKALRAIMRQGQKESNWMTDYNRKLAKNIVSFAQQFHNPIIKLEQLGDIRSTCRSMKRADKTIHSWAFYQLKQFIQERASKFDIPVVDINPYKTSQTCFHCGHAEKSNRYRDRFQCKKCGHNDHADLNASKNIARA